MRKARVVPMVILAGLFLAQAVVRAGETRPFYAEIQVTAESLSQDWQSSCLAMGYDGAFEATRAGQATHLGRVTSVERGCLRFDEYPIVHSKVWLTLTAANGDTLASINEIAFDFSNDESPATGNFTITGGTGRFARAVGVGTLRNVAMQGNAGFVIIQEGWISYEASDRGADK